ncbi:hypothetical protein BKA65DRAFT_149851 [Rhexocercosporidium sp. MPI-PUGE-AT-0058]|nr:hypothetical protein BKA65DRAFT_149851 [Rhexocercosporidium sp. MPI-PUGE-AT-0058]
MPILRSLELTDYDIDRRQIRKATLFQQLEDDEVMFRNMIHPMRWEDSRVRGWGRPAMGILFSLPIAIHKAGIYLTNLDIQISPPEDFSPLAPTEADLCDLKASMKQMKFFNFWIRGREASFWPRRPVDEVKHVVKYESALLDTANLRRISLDVHCLWDENMPPRLSLLKPRPWPQLRSFSLWGVPAHYTELAQILDGREKPITFVNLRDTHLISGTWADILDLLRNTYMGCTSLEYPTGAECDTLSDEDRKRIFLSSVGLDHLVVRSLAERYIARLVATNPLRDLAGDMEDAE